MKLSLQKIDNHKNPHLVATIKKAKKELAKSEVFGPFSGSELDEFLSCSFN